jgi:hypothetical protein
MLLAQLEKSEKGLDLMTESYIPIYRTQLKALFKTWLVDISLGSGTSELETQIPVEIHSDVMSRLHEYRTAFPCSFAAATVRRQASRLFRDRRNQMVKDLQLQQTDSKRNAYLATFPCIQVPNLVATGGSRFPPKYSWLCENSEFYRQEWAKHFAEGKLHDQRSSRKPVEYNSHNAIWAHVVHRNKNAIFYDQDTGELILLVMRNFCKSDVALQWADEVAKTGLEVKKSIRLDDPGKLAMIGYTTGSRNSPKAMWAKNLLRQPTRLFQTPDCLNEFDFNCSSVFALLWNMMQKQLPDVVLEDIKELIADWNLNMDGDGKMGSYYGLPHPNGDYYEFHNCDLAPPQGNFAKNYARFCHHENNAHKYCYAWTTSRKNDWKEGGEFYVADYAIKVESSANTMIVWRGKDFHGTTLPHCLPDELESKFQQIGLSIATSGRMKKILEEASESGEKEKHMFARLAELELYDEIEEEQIRVGK